MGVQVGYFGGPSWSGRFSLDGSPPVEATAGSSGGGVGGTVDDGVGRSSGRPWGTVDEGEASKIREAREAGGRVIAVGTTTVRVLETASAAGAPTGTPPPVATSSGPGSNIRLTLQGGCDS